MMRRLRRIGWGSALLAGCAAEVDIVAQPVQRDDAGWNDAGAEPLGWNDAGAEPLGWNDAGAEPLGWNDAGAEPLGWNDAGVAPECCDGASGVATDRGDAAVATEDACAGGGDTFFLLTKTNISASIYRVSAKTGSAEFHGTPGCAPSGALTAAVDERGTFWVAALQDGSMHEIDPHTLECQPTPLKLAPTAMTFGVDPDTEQQRLYAVEASILSVIDPTSFARSAPGTLEASWLAGTADGRLFALSQAAAGLVTVDEIDPRDASVTPRWSFLLPAERPLRGAALASGGFALIVGTDLYRAPIDSDKAEFIATLFQEDPGILAVSAPPCAWLPK